MGSHDPGNAVTARSGYTLPITQSSPFTLLRLLRKQTVCAPVMSYSDPTASSSNFQLIINNALDSYKRRTKNDLLSHPLAAQLQFSKSPSEILTILQEQVQSLHQSQRNDEWWTRLLDPTVNVLYTLSATLGEGVGLVRLRT